MTNNKGKFESCHFEADIVSNIYREVSNADRERFDSHLSDCLSCSEELAGFLNVHGSVVEWRDREFSGLASPPIIIPYESIRVDSGMKKKGSAAFAIDLFTLKWPVFAVAAVLAIVIASGFVSVYINDNGSTQVAIDALEPIATVGSSVQPTKTGSIEIAASPASDDVKVAASPVSQSGKAGNSSGTKGSKRIVKRQRNRMMTTVIDERNFTAKNLIEPTLATDATQSDASLRLSDLFDINDVK